MRGIVAGLTQENKKNKELIFGILASSCSKKEFFVAYVYIFFGWVFFGIGIVGVYVPLLPTVPFLLLTSYCFLKGSKKLHTWFVSIKYVGPLIKDWEEHKRIPVRAKIMATTMIVASVMYTVVTHDKLIVRIILPIVAVSVITFILTRKSK